MVQEAKARGNARDTPTWTTMVGRKGSKSECRRHEPGGDARVCMEGVALADAGTRRLQAPKAHLHSRPAWRHEDGPPAATAVDEVLGGALSGGAEGDAGQSRQADRRGRRGQVPVGGRTAGAGEAPDDPPARPPAATDLDSQTRPRGTGSARPS